MGRWGEFRVNNDTLLCTSGFLAFCFFVVFHQIFVFLSFPFLFLMKIEFLQQNINQSESGIGDKKLSVELYVTCNIQSNKQFN